MANRRTAKRQPTEAELEVLALKKKRSALKAAACRATGKATTARDSVLWAIKEGAGELDRASARYASGNGHYLYDCLDTLGKKIRILSAVAGKAEKAALEAEALYETS